MTQSSHVSGWASDAPTPAQIKELFDQIGSGRITKAHLQSFLRPSAKPPTVSPDVWLQGQGFTTGSDAPDNTAMHMPYGHTKIFERAGWRWDFISRKPNFVIVGKLYINSHFDRGQPVDEKHWLLEVCGDSKLPRLQALAQEMRNLYRVELTVVLVSATPEEDRSYYPAF